MKNNTIKRFVAIILFVITTNPVFAQDNRIDEPIRNFDFLWNEFNDRYSFFELKKLDWKKVYKKYRPLINDSTTNDSLFSICNQMLLELKDGHVGLEQYDKNGETVNESDEGQPSILRERFPYSKKVEPNMYLLLKTTKSSLIKNGFSDFVESKSTNIIFSTSKEYGYIVLDQMMGFAVGEVKKNMDKAIKAFKNKKAVIVDIRQNSGGYGRIAFAMAGRFADKKRVTSFVKERIEATNQYIDKETTYITPKGKRQFTNPIILITSDMTASAAEEFTLAMKQLPYVTILGDNTEGSFSDQYEFELPNKWSCTLSHQQYFSPDMINYEEVGIEPDIRMSNKVEDIVNGIDPLIVKALELLGEKNYR
jgi:carboxyl-terminal processing protease